MALSELIKYEGDNSTFIWKYPHEDFNNMTELIVHESQEAIFFANGVAADTFGPGRYKLDAKNIPILTHLINIVTGVSVFHCEVYFINKTVQMGIHWGTSEKVRFTEPTMGLPVELGASGQMNLAVSDGRKLLLYVVGTTKGIAWETEGAEFTKSLQKAFHPIIMSAVKANLPAVIKQQNIDIVEVDEHLDELSAAMKTRIQPAFEEYGITVPQFYLTTIALPENDPNYKKLKDLHTVTLQQRMAWAEAQVRTAQAQSRASYETAEAEARSQVTAAQRGAILEEQTTETEVARRQAERDLIAAQVEAQKTQLQGMAEAQVMQAKGYTQKDVLQADVQKAFAEGIGNMGPDISAGGGSSPMGDIMGLGVTMAAMNTMMPQMQNMMQGLGGQSQPAPQQTMPPVQGNSASSVQDSLAESGTIKCPTCGNELPTNAKFCLECGTKIEQLVANEMICPACGKKTMKGKFCLECGTPLIRKCQNCGAEVPQGGKFCLECGTKL